MAHSANCSCTDSCDPCDTTSSITRDGSTDIFMSLMLLTLSGLFSGLTLGLMSLDVDGLEIIISGEGDHAEYARRVLPIRRKGNLLLCTLLLGNTLVNALIAILSASFGARWRGRGEHQSPRMLPLANQLYMLYLDCFIILVFVYIICC